MNLTLHFDTIMIVGLCMIPGGILTGILITILLGELGWEIGSLIGLYLGIIIAIAGIMIFLVGLGMEIH